VSVSFSKEKLVIGFLFIKPVLGLQSILTFRIKFIVAKRNLLDCEANLTTQRPFAYHIGVARRRCCEKR
jgi:hypothetical protein